MSFPIFLKDNQHILVVGNGDAAIAKLQILSMYRLQITIQSDKPSALLSKYIQQHSITWLQQSIQTVPNNTNYQLIVDATLNATTNQIWSQWAKDANILCNCVDNTDFGTVQFGAIVKRDFINIGINTQGQLPSLATYIRKQFEMLLPSIALIKRLLHFKEFINKHTKSNSHRSRIWHQLLSLAKTNSEDLLSEQVKHIVKSNQAAVVSIVGAGPGDEQLLTIKAHNALASADYILYDRLVNSSILNLARRDAILQLVGKNSENNKHSTNQNAINQDLVKLAKQGYNVVRLKGGDPFIFGRGGEELQFLQQANIDYQVIPGITSALGCASYCDIPLTHRDYANSLRLITAHRANGQYVFRIDRQCFDNQTVIFYMAVGAMPEIYNQLLTLKIDLSLPIAIVENGTTNQQKLTLATAEQLPNLTTAIKAPAIIIMGRVVSLHPKWQETQSKQ